MNMRAYLILYNLRKSYKSLTGPWVPEGPQQVPHKNRTRDFPISS